MVHYQVRLSHRYGRRRDTTWQREALMKWILHLEADGMHHSSAEIDHFLDVIAGELGYSDEDVARALAGGRRVFGNDGDWAIAELTDARLHQVTGRSLSWENGALRECNVYRITPAGLAELRERWPHDQAS